MRLPALRSICFGALAALALTGCGDGHLNNPPTFSWYVFDIEQGVSDASFAMTCGAAGASTVVITLTDVNGAGAPIQATAPCTAGVASLTNVPRGSYYADFSLLGDPEIYGDATTELDRFRSTDTATGSPAVYAIGPGHNNDFTATYAPFVAQAFSVTWAVYLQGALTTCAAVGASYVYLDFTVAGSASRVSTPFTDCDGGGTTHYSYAIPVAAAGAPLGSTAQWTLSLTDRAGVDIQVIDGGNVTLPTSTNVNLAPQYFSF